MRVEKEEDYPGNAELEEETREKFRSILQLQKSLPTSLPRLSSFPSNFYGFIVSLFIAS